MAAPVSACVQAVEFSKGHDTSIVWNREQLTSKQHEPFVKMRKPSSVAVLRQRAATLILANSPEILLALVLAAE